MASQAKTRRKCSLVPIVFDPILRVHDRTRQRWAIIALILGAASIGLAPILVRYAKDEGVGPNATAFYRLAIALPILGAWMTLERRRSRAADPRGRDAGLLLLTGLFFAADLAFWPGPILLTKVANATLLACLASTFAAVAAWIFFRERLTGALLIGLVTALVGSGLLMSRSFAADQRHLLGDAFGLLAALFYAGYLLGVGGLRGRFSTATVMTWTGAGAIPILLLVAFARNESIVPTTS